MRLKFNTCDNVINSHTFTFRGLIETCTIHTTNTFNEMARQFRMMKLSSSSEAVQSMYMYVNALSNLSILSFHWYYIKKILNPSHLNDNYFQPELLKYNNKGTKYYS